MSIVRISGDGLIGPYVHRSLQKAPNRDEIDPEVMGYFDLMAKANEDRNLMLKSQLEECSIAFAAEGVSLTTIKGGALLARAPDARGIARIVGDLDILISPTEVAVADSVLRGLGYDRVPDSEWGHGAGSYERPDCAGSIDVHVRLPDDISAVLGDMQDRLESVRLGDIDISVPDASYHVLLNVAHEMLHDRGLATGFMELRYLLELDSFVRLHAASLDWTWIEERFRDERLRLSTELQDRMAERLLGTHLFPKSGRTLKGRLLHTRRVFKANWVWFGDVEWDVVLFVKSLRDGLRKT